ncbi:MAG: DUF2723 domain-containing protein [Ardenticatenales bacterium]
MTPPARSAAAQKRLHEVTTPPLGSATPGGRPRQGGGVDERARTTGHRALVLVPVVLPVLTAAGFSALQRTQRPVLALVATCAGAALSLAALATARLASSNRGWASRAAGIVTVLTVAGAYFATMSPTTAATDSVEFQIVATSLRIAHAPGYPLYTMLGHVVTWLPVGDVAWRMNAFSALCGTIASALAYRLGRRLGPGALAGATAAFGLAFAPQLWSQVVITEVYALNMVLVLGVLVCLAELPTVRRPRAAASSAAPRPSGAAWRLAALFLCGLGFTHHITIAFIYPIVALVVLRGDPRLLTRARDVAWSAAALAAGLLPLAYLPLRWRAVNGTSLDVVSFLRYITGRNYPGLFDLGRLPAEPARWILLGTQLHDAFGWFVFALAAVGVITLAMRRSVWALALPALFGAFALFYLGYFAWDGWVVLLPALAAIAVAAGVGAALLARAPFVRGDSVASRIARTGIAAAIATAVALSTSAALWRVGPRVDSSRGWEGQAAADRALAEPIPTGARLVVDPAIGAGFLYDRHLRGVRADLDVVYADWPSGRNALADPLGQDRPIVTYGVDIGRYRPADGVHPQPLGPFWLLSATAATAPPDGFASVAEDMTSTDGGYRLVGWRIEPEPVRPGDDILVQLAWRRLRSGTIEPASSIRLYDTRERRGFASTIHGLGPDDVDGAGSVAAVPAKGFVDGARAETRFEGATIGEVVVEVRPVTIDPGVPAARYDVQVVEAVAQGAAPDAIASDIPWRSIGQLYVQPITRHVLAHDPAFADVLPMRRVWPDGVELLGVDVPSGTWPGQPITVVAFWGHGADRAPLHAIDVDLRVGSSIANSRDPASGVAAPLTRRLPDGLWPGGDDAVWVTRWQWTVPSGPHAMTGSDVLPPRIARMARLGDTPGDQVGAFVRLPGLTYHAATPGLDAPVQFDDGAALVAFEPRRRIVAPGDWIEVRTDWTAVRRPPNRDKAFVQLLDAAQAMRAGSDREVLYGAEPTDTWRPGGLVTDRFFVRVPSDMPQGPAWLQVGLYDKSSQARRRLVAADGSTQDDRFLTGVYIAAADEHRSAQSADVPARISFEGGPLLTAVRLSERGPLREGEAVTVTLDWAVDAPPRRDWTVFLHLLASADAAEPIAQADGMPFGSIFPMRLWPRGAVLRSTHRLVVPADPPADARWAVAVGLYDAATLERAPASGAIVGGSVDEGSRRVVIQPGAAPP